MVDLLSKAGDTCSYGHHEGSDSEAGVDGHKSSTERCSSPFTTEQHDEAEEPYNKLTEQGRVSWLSCKSVGWLHRTLYHYHHTLSVLITRKRLVMRITEVAVPYLFHVFQWLNVLFTRIVCTTSVLRVLA